MRFEVESRVDTASDGCPLWAFGGCVYIMYEVVHGTGI